MRAAFDKSMAAAKHTATMQCAFLASVFAHIIAPSVKPAILSALTTMVESDKLFVHAVLRALGVPSRNLYADATWTAVMASSRESGRAERQAQ